MTGNSALDKEEAPPRLLCAFIAVFLIAVLVMLVLVGALDARIVDYDELWHLAAGRVILESGEVPFHDPFTYTAGSTPWVNSNWAAQVILFTLYRAGGLELCWVLGVGLSLFTLALVGINIRSRVHSAWVVLPVLVYVLLVLGTTSQMRPQGWTFALLALAVVLVERSRRGAPFRYGAVLAGLIGLAGQLHGGYFFLPFLLALAAAAEIWDLWRGAPAASRRRFFALVAGLVGGLALVALLHPHHWEAIAHPIRYRFDPAFRELSRLTQELAPPDLKTGPGLLTAIGVLGLLGLVLAGRPALRTEDVLIAFGFAYLALTSLRGLHYFAIAAAAPLALALDATLDAARKEAPVLIRNQLKVLDSLEPAARDFARFAPLALATAGLFCLAWFFPRFAPGEPGAVSSPLLARQSELADMTRFLAANHPPGNIWNEFELGGALVWGLYPRQVYIDGRGDLHARAGTFQEYLTIQDTDPGYEKLLDNRRCDLVVAHGNCRLAARLRERGWRVIHRSPDSQCPLELLARPGSAAGAQLLRSANDADPVP